MKKDDFFQHPRQCPKGHRQISWNAIEKLVHCWMCGKDYPISECLAPSAASPSGKPDHETPERPEAT
jgi:hypothetical protein